MKSYDLLVLVVFIPEGRPQQRILLLGGRLAKLASDLVRVFASLDGGWRFLRQFGSRQNRPLAGGVIAASAAGGPAGEHVAAAIGATAQYGSVSTGRACATKALIRCRAYAASGDGLLFGAHDFVEVFQGFVEDTLRIGYAACCTGTAFAAAGPGALLVSGARGIAPGPTLAGFLTTRLAGVATLTAAFFAAVTALHAVLSRAVLALATSALAARVLTTRLAGVATLTAAFFAAVTALHAVLSSAVLALATSALATGLTGITALAVTVSILTLGIALLTARLTGSTVTLTTCLLALLALLAAR